MDLPSALNVYSAAIPSSNAGTWRSWVSSDSRWNFSLAERFSKYV